MNSAVAPVHLMVNDIAIQVVRKKIKYLHLRVIPPHGSICVSAPWHLTDEQIRLSLMPKLDWLKKHQQHYHQYGEPLSELISGDAIWLWGECYRLEVTISQDKSALHLLDVNKVIQLKVPANSTREQRLRIVETWYRQQLKQRLHLLSEKWLAIIGVQVHAWGIKKMRTRWGSCNTVTKRVWLNLELAKKSPECLEYVLVHELVHLLERSHNHRFQRYMDNFLPDWRQRKQTLAYLASAV